MHFAFYMFLRFFLRGFGHPKDGTSGTLTGGSAEMSQPKKEAKGPKMALNVQNKSIENPARLLSLRVGGGRRPLVVKAN